MESRLLAASTFLYLAVVVSQAAISSEIYWKTMLPDVPMPKAVKEVLSTGNVGRVVNDGKNGDASDEVGKVVNDALQRDLNVFRRNAEKKPNLYPLYAYYGGNQHASDEVGQAVNDALQQDLNVFRRNVEKKPNLYPLYAYYAGNQCASDVGKAVNDALQRDPNAFLDNPEKAVHNIFFLEKDLHSGRKLNVDLARYMMVEKFLPRQKADTIPFSSDRLSEIMEMFSVKPKSVEAKAMEETIRTCESPANEGEDKYCATSLESMVDFIVYKLGKNVQSISTEVGKEEIRKRQYTVGLAIRRVGGANSIVCHSVLYPYLVYHCHETIATMIYKVPLSTTEGSNITTVVVCHSDTSKWNPEYQAFQILKVKPGVPVCHFLPDGHIVWTSSETYA